MCWIFSALAPNFHLDMKHISNEEAALTINGPDTQSSRRHSFTSWVEASVDSVHVFYDNVFLRLRPRWWGVYGTLTWRWIERRSRSTDVWKCDDDLRLTMLSTPSGVAEEVQMRRPVKPEECELAAGPLQRARRFRSSRFHTFSLLTHTVHGYAKHTGRRPVILSDSASRTTICIQLNYPWQLQLLLLSSVSYEWMLIWY